MVQQGTPSLSQLLQVQHLRLVLALMLVLLVLSAPVQVLIPALTLLSLQALALQLWRLAPAQVLLVLLLVLVLVARQTLVAPLLAAPQRQRTTRHWTPQRARPTALRHGQACRRPRQARSRRTTPGC
jgi:hypothetical protein